MSKGEVTREEMLEILDDEITQTRAGLRLARGIKAGSSIDAWKRQGIVLQALRRLIESRKVSRAFVEEYFEGGLVDTAIKMLTELGHEVEE